MNTSAQSPSNDQIAREIVKLHLNEIASFLKKDGNEQILSEYTLFRKELEDLLQEEVSFDEDGDRVLLANLVLVLSGKHLAMNDALSDQITDLINDIKKCDAKSLKNSECMPAIQSSEHMKMPSAQNSPEGKVPAQSENTVLQDFPKDWDGKIPLLLTKTGEKDGFLTVSGSLNTDEVPDGPRIISKILNASQAKDLQAQIDTFFAEFGEISEETQKMLMWQAIVTINANLSTLICFTNPEYVIAQIKNHPFFDENYEFPELPKSLLSVKEMIKNYNDSDVFLHASFHVKIVNILMKHLKNDLDGWMELQQLNLFKKEVLIAWVQHYTDFDVTIENQKKDLEAYFDLLPSYMGVSRYQFKNETLSLMSTEVSVRGILLDISRGLSEGWGKYDAEIKRVKNISPVPLWTQDLHDEWFNESERSKFPRYCDMIESIPKENRIEHDSDILQKAIDMDGVSPMKIRFEKRTKSLSLEKKCVLEINELIRQELNPIQQAQAYQGLRVIAGRLFSYISKAALEKPVQKNIGRTLAGNLPIKLDVIQAQFLKYLKDHTHVVIRLLQEGKEIWDASGNRKDLNTRFAKTVVKSLSADPQGFSFQDDFVDNVPWNESELNYSSHQLTEQSLQLILLAFPVRLKKGSPKKNLSFDEASERLESSHLISLVKAEYVDMRNVSKLILERLTGGFNGYVCKTKEGDLTQEDIDEHALASQEMAKYLATRREYPGDKMSENQHQSEYLKAIEIIPEHLRLDKDTDHIQTAIDGNMLFKIKLKYKPAEMEIKRWNRVIEEINDEIRSELEIDKQRQVLRFLRLYVASVTSAVNSGIQSKQDIQSQIGFQKLISGEVLFRINKNINAILKFLQGMSRQLISSVKNKAPEDELLIKNSKLITQLYRELTLNLNIGRKAVNFTSEDEIVKLNTSKKVNEHFLTPMTLQCMALELPFSLDKEEKHASPERTQELLNTLPIILTSLEDQTSSEVLKTKRMNGLLGYIRQSGHVSENQISAYIDATEETLNYQRSFRVYPGDSMSVLKEESVDESFLPTETFIVVSENEKKKYSVTLEMMDRKRSEEIEKQFMVLVERYNKLSIPRQKVASALYDAAIRSVKVHLRLLKNAQEIPLDKSNISSSIFGYYQKINGRDKKEWEIIAENVLIDLCDVWDVVLTLAESEKKIESIYTSKKWKEISVGFVSQILDTYTGVPMSDKVRESLIQARKKSHTQKNKKNYAKSLLLDDPKKFKNYKHLHFQAEMLLLDMVTYTEPVDIWESDEIRLVSHNHYEEISKEGLDLDVVAKNQEKQMNIPAHLKCPVSYLYSEGFYGDLKLDIHSLSHQLLMRQSAKMAEEIQHYFLNKKDQESAQTYLLATIDIVANFMEFQLEAAASQHKEFQRIREAYKSGRSTIPHGEIVLEAIKALDMAASSIKKSSRTKFSKRHYHEEVSQYLFDNETRWLTIHSEKTIEQGGRYQASISGWYKKYTEIDTVKMLFGLKNLKATPGVLYEMIDSFAFKIRDGAPVNARSVTRAKKRFQLIDTFNNLVLKYQKNSVIGQKKSSVSKIKDKKMRHQGKGREAILAPLLAEQKKEVLHYNPYQLLTDTPLLGNLQLHTQGMDPELVSDLNNRLEGVKVVSQEKVFSLARASVERFVHHSKQFWDAYKDGQLNGKAKLKKIESGQEPLDIIAYEDAIQNIITHAIGSAKGLESRNQLKTDTYFEREWTKVIHDPLKKWAMDFSGASNKLVKSWLGKIQEWEGSESTEYLKGTSLSLDDITVPALQYIAHVTGGNQVDILQKSLFPELTDLERKACATFIDNSLRAKKRDIMEVKIILEDAEFLEDERRKMVPALLKMLNAQVSSPLVKRNEQLIEGLFKKHLESIVSEAASDGEEDTVAALIIKDLNGKLEEVMIMVLEKTEEMESIPEEDLEKLIEVENWLKENPEGMITSDQREEIESLVREIRSLVKDSNTNLQGGGALDVQAQNFNDLGRKDEALDDLTNTKPTKEFKDSIETAVLLNELGIILADGHYALLSKNKETETFTAEDFEFLEILEKRLSEESMVILTPENIRELRKEMDEIRAEFGVTVVDPKEEAGNEVDGDPSPKDSGSVGGAHKKNGDPKVPGSKTEEPGVRTQKEKDLSPKSKNSDIELPTNPTKTPDPTEEPVPAGEPSPPQSTEVTPVDVGSGASASGGNTGDRNRTGFGVDIPSYTSADVVIPAVPQIQNESAEDFLQKATQRQVLGMLQQSPEVLAQLGQLNPETFAKIFAEMVKKVVPGLKKDVEIAKKSASYSHSLDGRENTRKQKAYSKRPQLLNEERNLIREIVYDEIKEELKRRTKNNADMKSELADITIDEFVDMERCSDFIAKYFNKVLRNEEGKLYDSTLYSRVLEEIQPEFEESTLDSIKNSVMVALLEYGKRLAEEILEVTDASDIQVTSMNVLTKEQREELSDHLDWLKKVTEKCPVNDNARIHSATREAVALSRWINEDLDGFVSCHFFPAVIVRLRSFRYRYKLVKKQEKWHLASQKVEMRTLEQQEMDYWKAHPSYFSHPKLNEKQGQYNVLKENIQKTKEALISLEKRLRFAKSNPDTIENIQALEVSMTLTRGELQALQLKERKFDSQL
ncbi:MAG: hypothetical protein P1V18_00390 [Candidatus Gracilibacteria bacterium]|nr:hypothetical protein [Candidatus Gracilibacteria bacterium]